MLHQLLVPAFDFFLDSILVELWQQQSLWEEAEGLEVVAVVQQSLLACSRKRVVVGPPLPGTQQLVRQQVVF
jgi:hypothetical protein